MKTEAKRLMEVHGVNFHAALAFGSRRMIHLVFASPVLTTEEKLREIERIVRLVFRFDNGSFTDDDAIEGFLLLGAVPATHPYYFRTPDF